LPGTLKLDNDECVPVGGHFDEEIQVGLRVDELGDCVPKRQGPAAEFDGVVANLNHSVKVSADDFIALREMELSNMLGEGHKTVLYTGGFAETEPWRSPLLFALSRAIQGGRREGWYVSLPSDCQLCTQASACPARIHGRFLAVLRELRLGGQVAQNVRRGTAEIGLF
jgi:hypothetical protein